MQEVRGKFCSCLLNKLSCNLFNRFRTASGRRGGGGGNADLCPFENETASHYRNATGVCFISCRIMGTEAVLAATSGVIPCHGLPSEFVCRTGSDKSSALAVSAPELSLFQCNWQGDWKVGWNKYRALSYVCSEVFGSDSLPVLWGAVVSLVKTVVWWHRTDDMFESLWVCRQIMRFVIPVVFCEITNLERVYSSNTTIFISRI